MTSSAQKLSDDFKVIKRLVADVPILFHIDLLQLGKIADPSDRDAFCAAYHALLEEVFGGQTYLIPTFNYEDCRSGRYDVETTPSEVGALTDYYRGQYPTLRTRTPVFHFCVRHNRGFSLNTHTNCFDEGSTFGELASADGAIVFLGAPLSANTFIHHVEEICDVPYRVHKIFPGQVTWQGGSLDTALTYRVRPLDGTVQYAWERIEMDLLQNGLMKEVPAGEGRALIFKAQELRSYWTQQLRLNPYALLL